MDAYLARSSCDDAHCRERDRLAAAVRSKPLSAAAWLHLLEHEEQIGTGQDGADAALYGLFQRATEAVPHSDAADEAYALLWIGYARQQWCAAMHNAHAPLYPQRCAH